MGKDLGISVAENIGLSESVGPGSAGPLRHKPPKPTIFNMVEVYYEDGEHRELVRRIKLEKNHFVAPGQMRKVTVKVVGR